MIKIDTRIRPFSHIKGSKCLIPGTNQELQAYPDLLVIGSHRIVLKNDPLCSSFTVQQDLESNCVWIFGKSYRLKVSAVDGGFEVVERGKKTFLSERMICCYKGDVERLFLGVNKHQDWDLIQRRGDLKEILPILYNLAQKTPPESLGLFKRLSLFGQKNLSHLTFKRPVDILDVHKRYLLDFDHIASLKSGKSLDFSKLFQIIRSLFVQETPSSTCLFSHHFSEGRLCNVQVSFGFLDMQWSKFSLQQIQIRPSVSQHIKLGLPENIKSFRVRYNRNERGFVQISRDPLFCETGKTMYLDRFYS